jgi:hypothetical protein
MAQPSDPNSLPDSLAEFKQMAIVKDCTACGEETRLRFLEDGECPGCRYGGDAA